MLGTQFGGVVGGYSNTFPARMPSDSPHAIGGTL